MTRTMQTQNPALCRKDILQKSATAALVGLTLALAPAAQAQQALGVPFIGKNHLSFSVTELSRNGFDAQQTAVFGGMYGRRIGRDEAPVQYTVLVRAAARALEGTDDGIVDAGLTVAATHRVSRFDALSVTGAVGVGAKVWAQQGADGQDLDQGRIITSTPISAGAAYDIRMGRATLSPFVTVNGVYSNDREYEDNNRVGMNDGWRLGHTAGMSLRFKETVLSLSGVNRERGMPHRHRTIFSAGVSW